MNGSISTLIPASVASFVSPTGFLVGLRVGRHLEQMEHRPQKPKNYQEHGQDQRYMDDATQGFKE
jgi:hypothetical protein